MISSARLLYCLLMATMVTLLGCPSGPPKSEPAVKGIAHEALLKRLTAMDEAIRFEVIEPAMELTGQLSSEDVESILTDLRPKNVSTLIYVCIQTKNKLLYGLKPPARNTLENSTGSFPNLAYYYARVAPVQGLAELLRLYDQHPGERLPISLAMGEVCRPEAFEFLLSQARRIKNAGGEVTAQLAGLKRSCTAVKTEDIEWMLARELDREEIIALSELASGLPSKSLKTLWIAKGQKRFFTIQVILGAPDTHFDSLRWMIDQYLRAGDQDTVRQLMFSDSMRSATVQRVIDFREATLAEVGSSEAETKNSGAQTSRTPNEN